MTIRSTGRSWRLAVPGFVAVSVLALVTLIGFQLQVDPTTAALIYLFVVVLISLWASAVAAVVVATAAVLCLDYFFTPPLFRVSIERTEDLVAAIAFVTTALVVTRLRSSARRSLTATQTLKNELELVVDTIPALTWSALPNGARDFVSRRWVDYTGVAAKDGLGSAWIETLHPDDRAGYIEKWKAAIAAAEPLEVETRLRRADGASEWFLIRAVPLFGTTNRVVRWYGTATHIEDRKRAERLMAAEKQVLEMTARGTALPVILDGLCRFIEELSGDYLASIMLLEPDGKRLRHGAAPSLPRAYVESIDGLAIGPAVGSCGTAAYRRESVLVSDLRVDPLWTDFSELASAHGLRACWSTPIVATDKRVLGTFAMYAREPWSPTPYQRDLVEQATHLASIAIERRQAEDVMEDHVRLLDLTHDTIFVRDANTDVISFWNRGAEQLYGWTRDEAMGRVTHELLKTVFPVPLDTITAQLVRAGRWDGELIHTTRAGTEVIVDSRWSLQRDAQGQPIATLETNHDITARKRAEEALIRQANLLEQTHDAIFVWEFAGEIVYWNRGAEQLYGYSRQEAAGRLTHELLQTAHPMQIPLFEATLERDGEWSGELTHTTRDGRRIIVESRHLLMRQSDGRRLVLENNRDITERRQAEDAVRKAEAELTHVARVATMGELAASIAHEVNQPLSGVVINANACMRWLGGDSPNLEEARDALQRIIRDGKRASEVVARVRAMSRKTLSERQPLDVNEAIRGIVTVTEGELRKNRVVLKTQFAEDLPTIMGDRVQLQQVVLNLMMNGIEAMTGVVQRPRELAITTKRDGERVRVSVRDSGTGLDTQLLERIFDAFYTTKHAGLGMGLSISRSIVKNHGGQLWAEPNDGPGTTFQFTV